MVIPSANRHFLTLCKPGYTCKKYGHYSTNCKERKTVPMQNNYLICQLCRYPGHSADKCLKFVTTTRYEETTENYDMNQPSHSQATNHLNEKQLG